MNPIRPVNLIVIHCSATRENQSYTPEQLEADHKARGFARAGYHYYIRRTGELVEMRPLDMVPAHVTGYNRHSIGICYEGGLNRKGNPADTRTEHQKATLEFLVDWLLEKYPNSRICGHRDLAKDKNGHWLKECPCFDVKSEYAFSVDS